MATLTQAPARMRVKVGELQGRPKTLRVAAGSTLGHVLQRAGYSKDDIPNMLGSVRIDSREASSLNARVRPGAFLTILPDANGGVR